VSKATFRVNYFKGGQATTAYVVAETDSDASAFLGVTDGSAQVNRVAYPVEVVGLDTAHAPLPAMAVTVAPFDLPKAVSRQEFDALQTQMADLRNQLAGQGKPVSLEPTQVQADPLPKE
jgi:hypothetical protein